MKKKPGRPRKGETDSSKAERDQRIYKMHAVEGLSYAQIGYKTHLSKESVRQIVREQKKRATGG
jgi:Mor family transcriptional regulator